MPIDSTSIAYQEMSEKWELTDALKSREKIHEGRERWLPREPRENPTSYNVRLSRSFLRPGYHGAIKRLVSKAFRKQVTTQGEDGLSEQTASIIDDVDTTKTDLTQFARDALQRSINRGVVHCLVDFPFIEGGAGPESRFAKNARARFVMIPAESLISWRFGRDVDGTVALTMIRYKYTETEQDPIDEFEEIEVEYIRKIDLEPGQETGTWQIWRKAPKHSEFLPFRAGTFTFNGREIPIRPFYTNKTGEFTAEPPMFDLAELNLHDYQVGSDESNNLRFMGFPRQVGTGFSQDEQEAIAGVGPAFTIWSSNPEARYNLVEHTGASAKVQKEYREGLRAEMEARGTTPLTQRTGDITATGQRIDESGRTSDLEQWVKALEKWLFKLFELAAMWRLETLPDNFSVDVAPDLSLIDDSLTPKDLIQLAREGFITSETLLEELKRRGNFAETFDPVAENEAAKAQMPPSLLTFPDEPSEENAA